MDNGFWNSPLGWTLASTGAALLISVGVLLAVLGYALGTYGAILCAQMMAAVG